MERFVVAFLVIGVSAVVGLQQEAATGHEREEVELQQGRLSGLREVTEGGRFYYMFLGIPFAQPPVGNLRFKVPVAAGGWTGVRDGSQHPQPCLQPTNLTALAHGSDNFTGSEDCLYLNVFTPEKPSHMPSVPTSTKLPVMVYIHGGGFIIGSIKDYDPSPLLRRDVVIVTLQYRLGIFGFLSTEDEILPGNLGLRDQTLALWWVKDNIHHFGGDPKRVTIFGESAGSFSVHLQILSPHANGLFQRAILQSGTALNPWAVSDNLRELAFKLGNHINCSAKDSMQLLACINQTSYQDIYLAMYKLTVWHGIPPSMVPRVDGDFLPQHPAQLIKTARFNKVDMISGFTLEEAAGATLELMLKSKADFESLKSNFSQIGPVALSFENEESPEYLTNFVFFKYFCHLNITEKDIDQMIKLLSDRYFKFDHEDTAEFHALGGQKVYQYVFEHRGQHSFSAQYNTSSSHYVDHGDDLLYLFHRLLPEAELTRPEDLFVRRIITDLWANFATTGNPTVNGTLGFRWTPTYPKLGGEKPSFLGISITPRMQRADIHGQNFWRNLPTKRNKILFPERFLED